MDILPTPTPRLFDGKTCARCHQWKTLCEYYRKQSSRDGFGYWCKKCQNESHSAYMLKVRKPRIRPIAVKRCQVPTLPPNQFRVVDDVVFITIHRRRQPSVEAIIDTADLETVQKHSVNWRLRDVKKSERKYVAALLQKDRARHILLHRLISQAPDGLEVDHINGNGLDNRRNNLRLTNRSENAQNRQGANRTSTTGIRNVYFDAHRCKYKVSLHVNGKPLRLGSFDNVADAEAVAIAARQRYYSHSPENSPTVPGVAST